MIFVIKHYVEEALDIKNTTSGCNLERDQTFQDYVVVVLSLTLIFPGGNDMLFYVVNLKRILTVLESK